MSTDDTSRYPEDTSSSDSIEIQMLKHEKDTPKRNNEEKETKPKIPTKFKSKVKLLIVAKRATRYSIVQKNRISQLPRLEKFKNRYFRQNSGFFAKEPRLISHKVHRFRAIIVLLLIILLTTAGVFTPIYYEMSAYYISYALIFGCIFTLFLFLDYFDNFDIFQNLFEFSCNGYSQK
eukprot:399173_1